MVGVICDTFVSNVNAAVDYGQIFVFINSYCDCICNNLSDNDCVCCVSKAFFIVAFNSFNCQFAFCANLSGFSRDYHVSCFDCNCICYVVVSCYFDSNFFFTFNVTNYCVICAAFQFVEFKAVGQFQCEFLTFFKFANVSFDLQIFFQCRDTFFCDFCYLLHGSFDTCIFNFCECQIICCYQSTVNSDCSLFANGYAFQLDVAVQIYGDDVFIFQFSTFDCQLEAVFFNFRDVILTNCYYSSSTSCNFNIFCNFCCCRILEFSTIQCECQFMLGCRTCCILTVTVNLQLQLCCFAIHCSFWFCIFGYISCIDNFSYCFSRTCVSKCCCGHQRYYHSCSHDHRDKFLHWSHSSFFNFKCSLRFIIIQRNAVHSSAALSAAPSLRALPLPPHPFKDSASVSSVPVWFPFLRQFYFA